MENTSNSNKAFNPASVKDILSLLEPDRLDVDELDLSSKDKEIMFLHEEDAEFESFPIGTKEYENFFKEQLESALESGADPLITFSIRKQIEKSIRIRTNKEERSC